MGALIPELKPLPGGKNQNYSSEFPERLVYLPWNFAWNPLPSHSLRDFHYFFVSLLLFLSYSCSLCSREEANWAVFVCIGSCFMCWQDLLSPFFGRWIWDGGLAATLGIAWICNMVPQVSASPCLLHIFISVKLWPLAIFIWDLHLTLVKFPDLFRPYFSHL